MLVGDKVKNNRETLEMMIQLLETKGIANAGIADHMRQMLRRDGTETLHVKHEPELLAKRLIGHQPVAYIAGPMTGIKYLNFPAFDKAKQEVESKGYKVISPADLDRNTPGVIDPMSLPENTDWSQSIFGGELIDAIDRDIEAIKQCDIIYMLKGWENSKGAKAERYLAEWMGKAVRFEDPALQLEGGGI